MARASRNLARKQKGSENQSRARRRLARVHARVADQRADHHHKVARRLVRTYDEIGVEDLRVKNMVRKGRGRRKGGLNRSIADAGWAQFRAVLDHQAAKAGKTVHHLDPRGTTQRCSSCGAKAKHPLGLADRVFECACGLSIDRDRNAARNLNPNRLGWTGAGDDGSKTRESADAQAA